MKPKDQTRELGKARYEFLKRNKHKFEEFLAGNDTQRFLNYCKELNIKPEEIDNSLAEDMETPAITGIEPCMNAYMRAFNKAEKKGDINVPFLVGEVISDMAEFSELYLDELIKASKSIIREYMSDKPLERLLVSIDLSRSTEVILSEIKTLVTSEKREMQQTRLSWLSTVKDLLTVWDLWVVTGEPARQAFKNMAEKLNVPESTVKARWYKAYELIYERPYETDPVRRQELLADKAIQELCLRCTDPICGNKHGAEEIGCSAYEKLAGKKTPRERGYGNLDVMTDKQSYKSYFDPEETE